MANVLIVGCGYVGAALGAVLSAEGHLVRGLRRNPKNLPPSIEPIAADVHQRDLGALLPDDLDFIFYTVASGGGGEAGYQAAYADGPANLIQALGEKGKKVKRIFFTSSTAVYPQTDGGWVDEKSPARPTHYAGRILLEGERIFLHSPYPAAILRLGGIYGPNRTRLIDAVRGGQAKRGAGAPRFTNRIHRDDCACALVHLMKMNAPERVYVGVDDEPAEHDAVLDWLADRLGVPRPRGGGGRTCTLAPGDEQEMFKRPTQNFRIPVSLSIVSRRLRGDALERKNRAAARNVRTLGRLSGLLSISGARLRRRCDNTPECGSSCR